MKGIFNRRPPQPKYGSTWCVLDYIRSLGSNKDLGLKQLSFKLVVLLALANASRASEIQALDIRYMLRKDGDVIFSLRD